MFLSGTFKTNAHSMLWGGIYICFIGYAAIEENVENVGFIALSVGGLLAVHGLLLLNEKHD